MSDTVNVTKVTNKNYNRMKEHREDVEFLIGKAAGVVEGLTDMYMRIDEAITKFEEQGTQDEKSVQTKE